MADASTTLTGIGERGRKGGFSTLLDRRIPRRRGACGRVAAVVTNSDYSSPFHLCRRFSASIGVRRERSRPSSSRAMRSSA